MAAIDSLVRGDLRGPQPSPGPRSGRWGQWRSALAIGMAAFRWDYDRELDSFAVMLRDRDSVGTMHCGEVIALRLAPTTDEVVGAEIEGWERFFLRQYPELTDLWRTSRHRLPRWFRRKATREAERKLVEQTAKIIHDSCRNMNLGT